jgi:hypothetical protein
MHQPGHCRDHRLIAAIAALEVDVTVAGDADAAALARILDQAGLAAHGRLKDRNALIHCDEVRQNLSAIQNREFCARITRAGDRAGMLRTGRARPCRLRALGYAL